jgi:NADH:ubiquinone oxidoreductase subunit K
MHDHTIEAVRNQYLVVAIILLVTGVYGLYHKRKNKDTISAELLTLTVIVGAAFHLFFHVKIIPF